MMYNMVSHMMYNMVPNMLSKKAVYTSLFSDMWLRIPRAPYRVCNRTTQT